MRRITLIVLCMIFVNLLYPLGTLRVESIKELPATHTNLEVYDADGKYAPVLRVKTELQGLGFQNIGRPTKHAPEYSNMKHEYKFYMNDSQRVIEITHTEYEPLEVRLFAEFGIDVKAQRVYEMVLTDEPEKEYIPVNIKVQPPKAIVKIDNIEMDCTNAVSISTGQHQIEIALNGYQTLVNNIEVTRERTLFEFQLQELENIFLKITSEPEGALVYLDEIRLGETPIAKNFLQGIYPIRLEKKEYETIYDTINIQPPEFYKNYTMVANIGSIEVTSGSQTGLDIYVNNRNTFNKTPYTFAKQEPGEYNIQAKSELYETNEQIFVLKKGEKKLVTLNPVPIYATLTINTSPSAEVRINNILQQQLENIQLEPSVYKIFVTQSKAESIEKSIRLNRNQVETLDLFPEPDTGTIQVAVSPYDAKVELTGDAGEYYVANGSKKFEKIPIGNYYIEVSRDRHISEDKTITINRNDLLFEEFNLKQHDKEMLRLADKYKVHRNYSLIASGAFLAFGLLSNFVADGYYDDYQIANTNASATSNRDNFEKWDSYRDYSYYISVGPILYSAYSWIKQIHYNKLAKTRK